MFPNVRLMIAAVVASIVALACGLGLFATFRVHHEPLSRIAAGSAPLQLAADGATPRTAESFGAHLKLMQTQITGAADAAASRPPPSDRADAGPVDTVEPPGSAVAAVATDAATEQPAAADPTMGQPAESESASAPAPDAAVAQAPETEGEAKSNGVAAAAPADATSDISSTASIAPPEPTPPAMPESAATEPPAPAPSAPSPLEQAEQETKPEIAAAPDTAAPAKTHHKAARRTHLAARPRAAPQRALAPARVPAGIGGPFVAPANH